jgi:hypothetical protein
MQSAKVSLFRGVFLVPLLMGMISACSPVGPGEHQTYTYADYSSIPSKLQRENHLVLTWYPYAAKTTTNDAPEPITLSTLLYSEGTFKMCGTPPRIVLDSQQTNSWHAEVITKAVRLIHVPPGRYELVRQVTYEERKIFDCASKTVEIS